MTELEPKPINLDEVVRLGTGRNEKPIPIDWDAVAHLGKSVRLGEEPTLTVQDIELGGIPPFSENASHEERLKAANFSLWIYAAPTPLGMGMRAQIAKYTLDKQEKENAEQWNRGALEDELEKQFNKFAEFVTRIREQLKDDEDAISRFNDCTSIIDYLKTSIPGDYPLEPRNLHDASNYSEFWIGKKESAPLFAKTLARLVWKHIVKPRLEKEKRNPPAITKGTNDTLLNKNIDPSISVKINGKPANKDLTPGKWFRPFLDWIIKEIHSAFPTQEDAEKNRLIVQGGWTEVTRRVTKTTKPHPDICKQIRSLAEQLAGTEWEWQDGLKSSSLYTLHQTKAGNGRGQASVTFEVIRRLQPYTQKQIEKELCMLHNVKELKDLPAKAKEFLRLIPRPPKHASLVAGSSNNTSSSQYDLQEYIWSHICDRPSELRANQGVLVDENTLSILAKKSGAPLQLARKVLQQMVEDKIIEQVPSSERYSPTGEPKSFLVDWKPEDSRKPKEPKSKKPKPRKAQKEQAA
jgi:hypothetical protein